MTIQEANKIATHSESKWMVSDQTNEIVELEVVYRNRMLRIIAETEIDWFYSSGDPENLDKESAEFIKQVLAVKYPDENLEDVLIETTDEELETIDNHYRGKTID